MTSLPKHRLPFKEQLVEADNSDFGARQICLIVGLVCLAGFFVDMLALGMPLNPFSVQWRVNLLQQTGDRSIILLFGSALLLYSQLSNRLSLRPFSLVLLGVGVAFMLSSVLVIRDSLTLKNQALSNISTQAEQIQTRIEISRDSGNTPSAITPEQFEQATQRIASQSRAMKQTARSGITKSGLASIGNLIVVGLGMVGLGRLGLVSNRRRPRG